MKKLLSLMLAMMLCIGPAAGLAEGEIDLGVIGGADGPTSIFVTENMVTSAQMLEDAIAAGRKVTIDFSIPEVEGINTGDPTVDGALTDLVEAIGVSASIQGDEYHMGMSLADQDVLTVGVAVNGEDAYIKSNLIGGTVVIGAKEVEPIINRLLDALVMMEALTEEDVASMKEELPELMEVLQTAMAQSAELTMTDEDLLKLDYSALTGVIMNLAAQVETIDEIVVPRMCDPATKAVRLSIDNAEFVSGLRACLQFVQDNPKLKNYIAAQSGYNYTDEELAEMWSHDGELYMEYGIYSSEEEFRNQNSFDYMLTEAFNALDTVKLLDGEFVTTVYMNDADEIVYLTSVLPMFNEEKAVYEADAAITEVKGTTEILNVVYTRQTVAQGVSHVCNIDVDGEGATIDVLAQENSVQIRLSDMASQTLLLTIDAVQENDAVKGTYITNEEEETVYSGSFIFAHSTSDAHFKTQADFTMEIAFTPAEGAAAEVPSLNGMTLPGYQAKQPQAKTDNLAVSYLCDYVRAGVDVNGAETLTVQFNDVKVVAECELTTSDPVDSIMSGNVVRPAELDEAAFLNWFVGAANSVTSWAGNLLMALPESLLSLILSMGMM
ncbi:MAG: hypothetical protein IJD99_05395 [Clostridia bacterium]|nr:hypothetical protein [Clostridia bacterium]